MSLEAFEIFFSVWLIVCSLVVIWFFWDERKDRKNHQSNEMRKLREINDRVVYSTSTIKDNVWDACRVSSNVMAKELRKNGNK